MCIDFEARGRIVLVKDLLQQRCRALVAELLAHRGLEFRGVDEMHAVAVEEAKKVGDGTVLGFFFQHFEQRRTHGLDGAAVCLRVEHVERCRHRDVRPRPLGG